MKTLSCCRSIAVGVVVMVSLIQGVYAEETFFGTRTPSVGEFVEGLKPALRFRGIKPTTVEADPEPAAVSMQLRFAFDSYELTDESRATLDNLSQALASDDLSHYTFMVEGHTDAVGNETYNLHLSEKRARSVMDYLVNQRGVDPYRLRVIGKGEAQLYDNDNPGSGVNRRVAIVNMGRNTLGGL